MSTISDQIHDVFQMMIDLISIAINPMPSQRYTKSHDSQQLTFQILNSGAQSHFDRRNEYHDVKCLHPAAPVVP